MAGRLVFALAIYIALTELAFCEEVSDHTGTMFYVKCKQRVSVFHRGIQTRENGMKNERKARVFYCFREFGSPDEIQERSCLHNISNENISLAVQFIKR